MAGNLDADPAVGTVEAVIISGPRRGEIVRLPAPAVPVVSDEEMRLLNEGLDLITAAIDRLEEEVRSTTEAFSLDRLERTSAAVSERLIRERAARETARARFRTDLARFEME